MDRRTGHKWPLRLIDNAGGNQDRPRDLALVVALGWIYFRQQSQDRGLC